MGINPGVILTPLDVRTPDEVVADALATFQARRPDWTPRNAAPEVIYLEALSQAVGDVLALGDTVLGGLAEALLSGIYGIPRLPGTQAVAEVTMAFDSTVTLTVPTGTRFLLADYGVELTSTADVSVTSATSATIQVATTEATSTVNGVSSATIDLLSSVPNALSVTLASTLAGGSEPEGSDEYVYRAGQRLARVTNSLVVPDHFAAYVLESGLASNAACIGAWDGTAIGTAGTDAGEVTVVCYGFGGQVSSGNRAALAEAMQAMTAAGVTVHCVEAALQSVAVTTTVAAEPGWDALVVKAAVEEALTTYLSPQTWTFGETVRELSLSTLVENLPGVDFVDTLSVTGAVDGKVTLDANEVATVGTLTVSVT